MIAVVIDRGRALLDLQGVVIEGKALVVGERTTHEWYLQAYGNKYRHNYADIQLILNRNRLQLAQGERIIVEIEPRRIVWFDYGKGVRETWRIL